jgi:glucuronoarabinoxylan endo-1,4-beta-xylanase
VNSSMYSQYAGHLTDYYNYMTDNGIDIYSVSIQNEPDYAHDWTWWSADEIVTFLKEYGGTFPFRVMAPESFQYRKNMSDPILNDPEALANMDILGAHLYGTQVNDFPYPLFKQKGEGKELWMTEVYYPNSSSDADMWPEALGVATHVHNSMVEAEFQAYVWWYIRRSYGPMKEDGSISKRGWMMAHFSKFVRTGFYRVEVPKKPSNGLFVSAYKSDTDVVIVVVNENNSQQSFTFSVAGRTVDSFEKYTTSGSKNMSSDGTVTSSNGSFEVSFDGQSATTLHATK